MINELASIQIKTVRKYEAIDITQKVRDVANKTGIYNGFLNLFCPHTTAGILINEPESGLLQDIEKLFSDLIPQDRHFFHDKIDNNAVSHLAACLINSSIVLPVSNGKIALGTWQAIIFCEFDGSRTRKLDIRTLGTD